MTSAFPASFLIRGRSEASALTVRSFFEVSDFRASAKDFSKASASTTSVVAGFLSRSKAQARPCMPLPRIKYLIAPASSRQGLLDFLDQGLQIQGLEDVVVGA